MQNNKAFFDQFKQEDFVGKTNKDIAEKCFGNQAKYYMMRQQSGTHLSKWQDERLEQIKTWMFKDKKILDIGCGEGTVDLLIATKFQPKLIIGIDIDHRMIKNAIDNMQKIINDQEQMKALLDEAAKQNPDEDVEMLTKHEEE